mgnify:CR=1 FL=1
MKNFPSCINEDSNRQPVWDYLQSISKNKKVKKLQFHAVVYIKFQEHSEEELTKVAEDFMKEMRYREQPFIITYHKDMDDNILDISMKELKTAIFTNPETKKILLI